MSEQQPEAPMSTPDLIEQLRAMAIRYGAAQALGRPWRKHLVALDETHAALRAALTPPAPTPSADDEAVLDEHEGEVIGRAELGYANGPAYERSRAAVLVRMRGVPEGFKLVPVEPTEAMLAATCDEHGRPRILEFTKPEDRSKPYLMARYIYPAMLAAAPAPEVK